MAGSTIVSLSIAAAVVIPGGLEATPTLRVGSADEPAPWVALAAPPAADPTGDGPRIRVLVEPFPTYLFHLLAVAEVGYRNEYGREHRESLPAADLEALREHGDLLRFSDGGQSPLSVALVFLPLYLNPSEPAALERYFELLDEALRTGDPEAFLEAYRDPLDRIRRLLPFQAGPYLAAISPLRETVTELGAMYVRN